MATHRLNSGDASALVKLIQLGYDAPVSEAGNSQLENAREALSGLANERKIALVAHSPLQVSQVPPLKLYACWPATRLIHASGVVVHACHPLFYQRAVATASAIFDRDHDHKPPIVEMPDMYERTASEYLMPSLMDRRIERLFQWLSVRDGVLTPIFRISHSVCLMLVFCIFLRTEAVIALVGHGQFFKRCLGLPRVMSNVEVIECSFNNRTGFGAYKTIFEGYPEPAAEAS